MPFGEHVDIHTLRLETGTIVSHTVGLSGVCGDEGLGFNALDARQVPELSLPVGRLQMPCVASCERTSACARALPTCEGMTKAEAPPTSMEATLTAAAMNDILVPAIFVGVVLCSVPGGHN